MSDLDALLAAVIDCPEDDTPRLVLADWMDDHGGTVPCPACEKKPDEVNHPPGMMFVGWGHGWQPCSTCGGSAVVSDGMRERAAFIRVQVELSQLPDPGCLHCWPGNGCHYHELRRRERELWAAFDPNDTARWLMPPPDGFDFRHLPTDGWETDGRPHVKAAMYRRGFVDEVRLSLAAFVGGECERCQGRGGEDRYLEDDPTNRLMHGSHWYSCPHCSGTGRVPGLARELFAAHPLTKCVLTCREPWALDTTNVAWWQPGVQVENRASLPAPLYRMLSGGNAAFGGMTYTSRDDAMTALSDAATAYGRAAAGLRPLTAPTPATR